MRKGKTFRKGRRTSKTGRTTSRTSRFKLKIPHAFRALQRSWCDADHVSIIPSAVCFPLLSQTAAVVHVPETPALSGNTDREFEPASTHVFPSHADTVDGFAHDPDKCSPCQLPEIQGPISSESAPGIRKV